MKSYAVIDRIEGDYAVCEVELIDFSESHPENVDIKETEMMDVSLEDITKSVGEIEESDILVVEHDGKQVTHIYYKDDDEKELRIEFLEELEEIENDIYE